MSTNFVARGDVGKHPIHQPAFATSIPTMSVVADDSVGLAPLTEPSCCSRGFAGRIEGWLLHSALQIDVGAHRGAIAGWLDSGGNPVFVYPEIAGYYLTAMG
jgi:hypothetical protein